MTIMFLCLAFWVHEAGGPVWVVNLHVFMAGIFLGIWLNKKLSFKGGDKSAGP